MVRPVLILIAALVATFQLFEDDPGNDTISLEIVGFERAVPDAVAAPINVVSVTGDPVDLPNAEPDLPALEADRGQVVRTVFSASREVNPQQLLRISASDAPQP